MLLLKSIPNHKCKAKVREIRDASFDEFVDEEMIQFDESLESFLESNEAKFMRYMAERDRER